VIEFDPSEMDLVKKLAENESIELEDAEAIFLAEKYSTSLVTNDKWLIKIVFSLGIDALWTTTLILLAVKKKIVSKNKGRNMLRKLVLTGLYLRTDVYEAIQTALEEIGSKARSTRGSESRLVRCFQDGVSCLF
jgi:predicted nucleic acid-binding protein